MGTDWRTSLSASASSIRIVRGSASFARRWRFSSIFARRASEATRSEEHTSELQSHSDLVCRLLLEKKSVGVKGSSHVACPRRIPELYVGYVRANYTCGAQIAVVVGDVKHLLFD